MSGIPVSTETPMQDAIKIAEHDTLKSRIAELEEQRDDLELIGAGLVEQSKRQNRRISELEKANKILREALEHLARLGNGDQYGNSNGNIIAQQALEALEATKDKNDG